MRLSAHVERVFFDLRGYLAARSTGMVEVRSAPDLEEVIARGIARHAESDGHRDVYLAVDPADAGTFARTLSRSLDEVLPRLALAVGASASRPVQTDDPETALRAVAAAHASLRGSVGTFVVAGRVGADRDTAGVVEWLAPIYLAHADVETTKVLLLAVQPRALGRRMEIGASARVTSFRPASVSQHLPIIERFLDSPSARVLVADAPIERAGYLVGLVRSARPRRPGRVISYQGPIGSVARCLLAAHASIFPDRLVGDLPAHPEIAFAEALEEEAARAPLTVMLSLEPTPDAPLSLREHEVELARRTAQRLAGLLTRAQVILTFPGAHDRHASAVWLEAVDLTLDAALAEDDVRAQLGDPSLPPPQRVSALVAMAGLAAGQGRDDEAIELGLSACRLAQGDGLREAMTLYALGTTLYRLGRHEHAVRTLARATSVAARDQHLGIAAHALVTMAGSHLAAGVHGIALRCLDAAVDCARASGDVSLELFARMWRGEALAGAGDDEAAVIELRAASELAERPSTLSAQLAPQAAEIHARLGALLVARGVSARGAAHTDRGRSLGCAHPLSPLP